MKIQKENYDVVVIGGGLAGFCAAVEAARNGAKTALIHNRPVFGGNSSSEIGVTPHGAAAFHAYARETGIISELLIEERAVNHAEVYENGWTNSVWDMVMYDLAVETENLILHLNTDFSDVIMAGNQTAQGVHNAADTADLSMGYYHRPAHNTNHIPLAGITAHTQNAEVQLQLFAKRFIDCTGDGIVADRAGCEWRMGSEGKAEFGEPHAPDQASADTMGNSIHFRCKNMGRPVPFTPPEWAVKHEDPGFFYEQGRLPKEERGGFWWLEIGVPHHTIHDNENIRHELTRHTLGVWDWMKNKDPNMMERTRNYALDWIGQVPGKRESRRIMGEVLVTEHDIQQKTKFEDEIAFGGWFIDLHTPGGLLAPSAEPSNAEHYNTFTDYAVSSYCGPYGLPLRSLISKDVPNLMMAGRNISCTHAALGTLRVMGTTALLGQAAGLAAAQSIRLNVNPIEVTRGESIRDIQQILLREGCFLPGITREDTQDLAPAAQFEAESEWQLSGAGPDSEGAHEGLQIWRDQPQYQHEIMDVKKAQLIGVGTAGIETISLCLTNTGSEIQTIHLDLQAVDHIWDYRVHAGPSLSKGSLRLPPGKKQWIPWEIRLPANALPEQGAFVRVALDKNPQVIWHVAGRVIPGHVGSYQIGENKYRRFDNGSTLSFKVSPPQNCFPAQSISRGASRPHTHTNLWASDPNQPLPQTLQWTWDKETTLNRIELSFPGHLLREYHAYAPFYRDAQCPKDYRIEARIDGKWEAVLRIKNNYQRHRIHNFASISSQEMRLVVENTNGDQSAQVYEIRCYHETNETPVA
ncbi:FAD-dependent oxidoreductase [Kiritimatiellaeota bacterium B1221]|nr:FAD-dependent oxidoreductase [Kiritimatiellaeota bacterium B1221]